MTQAEELELLELEEQEAKAKGAAAPTQSAPTVGPGETFINSAANAIPLGKQAVDVVSADLLQRLRPEPGARFGPAALAAGLKDPEPASFTDTYRDLRDTREGRSAAGSAQNPWSSRLGTATGIGLSLAAPVPKVAVGSGASGRLASNLLTGGAYTGVNSLANGKADWTRGELGQAVTDFSGADQIQEAINQAGSGNYGRAALSALSAGPLGGVAAGGLASAIPEGVRAIPFLRRPMVSVSPAAQKLERLGVDTSKLSLGQLNPEGRMAQLEEVGEHGIAGGHAIRQAREGGKEAWQAGVQGYDGAPGFKPTPEGTPAERLTRARGSFNDAYDALRDTPIVQGPNQPSVPAQLRQSFASVVDDPNVLATEADRGAVAKYLNNQATLPMSAPGQAPTIGPLMKMRSDIRTKLAGLDPKSGMAALLREAEGKMTGHIDANLPREAQAQLRAIDAQYAVHKDIGGAITRSGDSPAGFQPSHLSTEIKIGTDPDAYARGAGGPLRELAATGRQVFDAKVPLTGAKLLIHNIPGAKYAAGPLAAIANQPGMKQVLLNGLGQAPATGDAAYRLQSIIKVLRNPEPRQSRQPSPLDPYMEVANAP